MAVLLAVGMVPGIAHGALQAGSQVPVFTLKDVNGKAYPLSGMKNTPMTILYFFDPDSRPSIEGLLSLDQLAKQYRDADLTVWAEGLRYVTSQTVWDIESLRGLAALSSELQRQSLMIGYINAFKMFAITSFLAIPLILLLKVWIKPEVGFLHFMPLP